MRPSIPRPPDPRCLDSRFTLVGQPPRVSPEPSRTGPVLNRGKEEARVRSSGNPDRCYKCGGVGHYSKVCPHRVCSLCRG